MPPSVAAFTDTYLPTVNGVTYTIQTWRDRWVDRGGRMCVAYPAASDYDPVDDEFPVGSVAFPFYEGFRAARPSVPSALSSVDVDVVHAHTPFALGLAALRFARARNRPLVASYHTPTAEYVDYLADGILSAPIERVARVYERWYLNRAELVVVPSEPARQHLREIGVRAPVEVVPNGVDTDVFRPVDATAFRRRHGLDDIDALVGYTGRHGFEKDLELLVEAVAGTDFTVVFGGDGPARESLEERADLLDVDARFLGFLDREDLPAFYAALDVFAFPSPVETQGLVALEANACGTPVAGVDAGALSETIDSGETGYRAPPGDPEAFREVIERTYRERERLADTCLDRRSETSVDHAIDRLEQVYGLVA